MDKISMISSLFQFYTAVISHYQYLGIVLITASGFMLNKSIRDHMNCVKILSSIAIILTVLYLIFGLYVYQEMISQYKYLLDVNGQSKVSIAAVERFIHYQSLGGIVILLFVAASFICYLAHNGEQK